MAWSKNWDMTSYFPEFGGAAYQTHLQELQRSMEQLETDSKAAGRMATDNLDAWVELFLLNEKIMGDFSHVASYVGCLASAEVGNEAYKQAEAQISKFGAIYSKSLATIVDALKAVDDATFDALLRRPELEGAGFFLLRMRQNAIKTMSPEQEVLTAELGVDGMSAWGRLYSETSGRLRFDLPGADQPTPMSMKVSLLESPDAAVRKAVLENSNAAWDEVSYVTAAALNAIAGTRLTLYGKRGYDGFLEKPLHDAAVSAETLDAMWGAVEVNRTVAWSYLKKKAELLGKPALGFEDLSCPLPQGAEKKCSWDEGVDLVLSAFNARYPALGEFAESMIANNRVESEQRTGKRPGAYCSGTLKNRESRVFMNYGGGLGDISTLAHELGHAFHNFVMKDKRPMAARFPMTLAETASTFAERILQNELLENPAASKAEKLQVLTTRLNDAAVFLCNIHMRFVFEKAFYTERQQGEVSVSRLKELMLQAQRQCYGDALDPESLDPMFWASKMHFYITGVSFYNFPYTFGYLFSLGLAADVGQRGADGMRQYEELLKLTGTDTCEGVAQRALG
ncbi:M3 family oligoendopeptidase, partial [Pontiella sp.]|uniref:M3 family oligoendopeptidase n=1 Tax=Pontiella sp. TaxID=2837462 RepID=UPI0035629E91